MTSSPPTSPSAITRALLSGSLQKANDAVRADEEKDHQYAIEAYAASCELLDQVLGRLQSGGGEWAQTGQIVSLASGLEASERRWDEGRGTVQGQ